jgi:hypothetical protein
MGVRNAVGRCVAVVILAAATVPAVATESAPRFGIRAGADVINYKETASTFKTKDKGLNYVLGFSYDNALTSDGDEFHGLDGEYYFGKVKAKDGDGNELNDVKYSGLRFEGLGGSRIGNNVALDLIGGAAIDYSERTEDVTTDAHKETQKIVFLRMGLGFFHRVGNFRYRISGGVNYPIYSKFSESNFLPGENFSFSSKGVVSPFFKAQANYGLSGQRSLQVNVLFDTLKVRESADIDVLGYPWPKKEYTRMGVQGVFYF